MTTTPTPAGAATLTPPDMKMKVPTKRISIGTNPDTGDRQLQFTHITTAAGTGPFEIDPNYDSSTGTAAFSQAIYKSPSPGVPQQALISQWTNTQSGDTYWVQGTSVASTSSGQSVTLNDIAPPTDQWNFAAVEVTPGSSASAAMINPAPARCGSRSTASRSAPR